MEKGETHDEAGTRQSKEAGNVVRIPRDWFGPKEDLVPFGPAASQTNLVEPAKIGDHRRQSKLGSLTRRDPEPTATESRAPLDPNTFWGEDSSLIQGVVAGPAGAAEGPAAGSRTATRRRGIALLALRGAVRGGLKRALGTKTLAVSVCGFLILVASVVAWQVGGSQPRTLRASVAAGEGQRSRALVGASERQHIEWPIRHLGRTPQGSSARRRPRVHPAREVLRNTSRQRPAQSRPVPSGPTHVTYHSIESASAPTTTTYQASSTPHPSPAQSATDRATSTPKVASTAAVQSSPAAFGTSGALGPMSSPDG